MALELDKVREIAERVAASQGLELVDIEFKGGAGKQGRLLRVTIDRAPHVSGEVPGANASASDGTAAGNVSETSSPTPSPVVLGPGQSVAAEAPQGAVGPDGGAAVMGVTLEDCANVSREMSTILDVEDAVPGSEYLLEVSSPGLDRRLSRAADFERFTGSRVKVMTRQPLGANEKSKGNRHFEGKLEGFSGGRLKIDVNAPRRAAKEKPKPGKKQPAPHWVEIELENVETANLVPDF